MLYIDPANGESIKVDISMVKDLGLSLAIRAEEILEKLGVPHLSEQELREIRDPLNGRGEYASVLTYNDHLATRLNATVNIKASDLKLLSELHLIVVSLTAIDGGGELRYSEALANLYSQPNQLDKRTMFWEEGRLVVHYDGLWTKSEGQSGKASRKIKNTVIRTCSPRTSSIFLRCALWTKPAEARLVSIQFGEQAGAVHMKAFAARNGKDMGLPTNSAWARAYFNRKSVTCCKLQLHDLRHVLIGITKTISRSLAEKESGKMILAYEEAGARMSMHSLDTEDGRYAGEAHIAGVEGPDRQVYRNISDAFGRKVYGADFGYVVSPAPHQSSTYTSSEPFQPCQVDASVGCHGTAPPSISSRKTSPLPSAPLHSLSQPPPSSLLAPTPVFQGELPADDDHHHQEDAMDLVEQDSVMEDCKALAPVPREHPRDTSFALRAIAQDFTGFQLGQKVPAMPHKQFLPIDFHYSRGPRKGEIKYRVPLDLIDYGMSFEPFCMPEFLPSLSEEEHTKLMDTAAMRESFRCFFLHLAVELGVHPVALQVVPRRPSAAPVFCPSLLPLPFSSFLFLQFVCRERCRVLSQIIAERTAADLESDLQFFSEAVDSVLVRRVTENDNNFVDAQFLQAVWPPELDNVRLLIVFRDHLGTLSTHNWNLFTPRADAQASIEGGQEWTGRDVILSLKDGHFTILRHQDPNNHHPIQDLLDKMMDADVTSDVLNHPGERKLLHLESTLGGEPDRTRCMSVAQLHAQQLAPPELSDETTILGSFERNVPPLDDLDIAFHDSGDESESLMPLSPSSSSLPPLSLMKGNAKASAAQVSTTC